MGLSVTAITVQVHAQAGSIIVCIGPLFDCTFSSLCIEHQGRGPRGLSSTLRTARGQKTAALALALASTRWPLHCCWRN